jgi:hypothetical protein
MVRQGKQLACESSSSSDRYSNSQVAYAWPPFVRS